MAETTRKSRIVHEFVAVTEIFLIVLLFLFMFATYRMMLLNAFNSKFFLYGTAIVNAAVLAKVIAIGEAVHLGKRVENGPLIYSVLYKAFLFSLLVTAFELLEEAVKGYIRGNVVFNEIGRGRADELIARTLVMFLAFIPFFALRELSRVVGYQRTVDLFFKRRSAEWLRE